MLKKVILLCAALLLAPLAFASGDVQMAPAPTPMFGGFYLGAGLSYINLYSETKYTISGLGDPTFNVFDLNHGNYQVGGSLFAGYGQMVNDNFYLGGEIFGRWIPIHGSDDVTLTVPNNDTGNSAKALTIRVGELTSEGTVGAALKAGWVPVHNFMLYALIGGTYTYFKLDKVKASENISTVGRNHSWELGVMPGFGMAYAMNKNWILSLESTWEIYGEFSHNDALSGDNETGNLKTSADPHQQLVTLGLTYRIPYKFF